VTVLALMMYKTQSKMKMKKKNEK